MSNQQLAWAFMIHEDMIGVQVTLLYDAHEYGYMQGFFHIHSVLIHQRSLQMEHHFSAGFPERKLRTTL